MAVPADFLAATGISAEAFSALPALKRGVLYERWLGSKNHQSPETRLTAELTARYGSAEPSASWSREDRLRADEVLSTTKPAALVVPPMPAVALAAAPERRLVLLTAWTAMHALVSKMGATSGDDYTHHANDLQRLMTLHPELKVTES
jgi:hypothetical protein